MKFLGELLWTMVKLQMLCLLVAFPAIMVLVGSLVWAIVLTEKGTLSMDIAMILPAMGSMLGFTYAVWAVHKIDDHYTR